MFNSIFDGRVVAKLPFTPIYWVQGLSHRNLLGDDMTDCSFIFLYILCTMSIRQNIQKALGFAPSRAASKQVRLHHIITLKAPKLSRVFACDVAHSSIVSVCQILSQHRLPNNYSECILGRKYVAARPQQIQVVSQEGAANSEKNPKRSANIIALCSMSHLTQY